LLGGGVVGGIDITGGGVPDVDGGIFGFVDGGVDCVGQFALASITDPSGHVLVVGGIDVGGTDVGGGVNVCVHVGSFGFLLQSTGFCGLPVQLPAAHIVPFLHNPNQLIQTHKLSRNSI
jgi:hypothetical protein